MRRKRWNQTSSLKDYREKVGMILVKQENILTYDNAINIEEIKIYLKQLEDCVFEGEALLEDERVLMNEKKQLDKLMVFGLSLLAGVLGIMILYLVFFIVARFSDGGMDRFINMRQVRPELIYGLGIISLSVVVYSYSPIKIRYQKYMNRDIDYFLMDRHVVSVKEILFSGELFLEEYEMLSHSLTSFRSKVVEEKVTGYYTYKNMRLIKTSGHEFLVEPWFDKEGSEHDPVEKGDEVSVVYLPEIVEGNLVNSNKIHTLTNINTGLMITMNKDRHEYLHKMEVLKSSLKH